MSGAPTLSKDELCSCGHIAGNHKAGYGCLIDICGCRQFEPEPEDDLSSKEQSIEPRRLSPRAEFARRETLRLMRHYGIDNGGELYRVILNAAGIADETTEGRMSTALDRIRRECVAQVNGSTHYEGCAADHPYCRILAFIQEALRPSPPYCPAVKASED